MEDVLKYDIEGYNSYSYKREMLRKLINIDSYNNLDLPVVLDCVNDIEVNEVNEINTIKILSIFPMYKKFYELINTFYMYPHPYIELFNDTFIRSLICNHYKHAATSFVKDEIYSDIKLMYFIPVVYFYHHPTKWDDNEYIHLLTIINTLDFINEESDGGNVKISVTFKIPTNYGSDINTIVSNFLNEKTNKIYKDWSELRCIKLVSLEESMATILESCDLF